MGKLIGACFLLVCISCNNGTKKITTASSERMVSGRATQTTHPPQESSLQNKEPLSIKIFNNDTLHHPGITGFGYDIYKDDAIYIHQPHMPAIATKNGFGTAADAGLVAKLVVYKIQHNLLPPSVLISELDSLGVHQ